MEGPAGLAVVCCGARKNDLEPYLSDLLLQLPCPKRDIRSGKEQEPITSLHELRNGTTVVRQLKSGGSHNLLPLTLFVYHKHTPQYERI